jgi:hypothetical protein
MRLGGAPTNIYTGIKLNDAAQQYIDKQSAFEKADIWS